MTLLRAALAALALVLAVPAIALGSDRFVVRDVPVSPAGVVQERQAQAEFNLVDRTPRVDPGGAKRPRRIARQDLAGRERADRNRPCPQAGSPR